MAAESPLGNVQYSIFFKTIKVNQTTLGLFGASSVYTMDFSLLRHNSLTGPQLVTAYDLWTHNPAGSTDPLQVLIERKNFLGT